MPFEIPAPPHPVPAPPPPRADVDVGTIVSHVFQVWKKHLWLFAGFTMVVVLPAMLLAAATAVGTAAASGAEEPSPAAVIALVVVALPLVLALLLFHMGGLTYAAIQSLAGRPVQFGSMLSVSLRRLLPMVGAGVLAGALVGLGFVLLIVPGVIAACGLALVIPVVVAERLGPIEALKRSWTLTQGHKGTIFGTALVLGVINLTIGVLGNIVALVPILGVLLVLFVQVLTASIGTVWPAVAYHDIRVAKEGVGTEELAKVFE